MVKTTKIYPTSEELSSITTSIQCTEHNCTAIFRTKANLNLHLARHHKNKASAESLLKSDTIKLYFCPLETCIYNSGKSFTKMKYLKQHYLKIHSVKKYQCPKCPQVFSTECLMNLHIDYCGISFKCPDCSIVYNCYESLTTHARRKGHKIFEKRKYKELFDGDLQACSKIVCLVDQKLEQRILLPKGFLQINLEENARGLDNKLDAKQNNTPINKRKSIKRKHELQTHEIETQTQVIKAVVSSAGTQTEVISIQTAAVPRTSQQTKATQSSTPRKSIKTQTTTVTSNSRACNTSFEINNQLPIKRNSLGTQTLNPHIPRQPSLIANSTSTATQSVSIGCDANLTTDIPPLATSNLLNSYIHDISNSNFCNANMETQTDWLTDLDLLSNDNYTHAQSNYTQTCDDILPPDLRFNNTHTQTVLNDILKSVGSQTNIRLNNGVCANCTNNETQTDSIFEGLLQEINS